MRLQVILLIGILGALGCARRADDAKVRTWLEKMPYNAFHFGRPDIPRMTKDQWLDDGRKINGIQLALRELLLRNDPNVELPQVAFALGYLGGDDSIAALAGSLSHQNYKVRLQAAVALGELGANNAVDNLCHVALTDDSENVRANAVVALGKIGGPKAISCLETALNYKVSFVAKGARRTLDKLTEARWAATVFPCLRPLSPGCFKLRPVPICAPPCRLVRQEAKFG